MFPSTITGMGHIRNLAQQYKPIGEAGGAKFWYHGLCNAFITVAERDLMLPTALTERLVNHAPPNYVTEGYAADWTIGQLRNPAQRIFRRGGLKADGARNFTEAFRVRQDSLWLVLF